MSTIRSTASDRPAAAASPGRARPGHEPGAERGTGLVGTFVGFVIFLVLLLFAAQVMVRMYATSALTSAAAHAAEQVAYSPDPRAATASAEAGARDELGGFGASHTRFDWVEVDANEVVLAVTARSPGILPLPGGWTLITRTIRIRTERFR